MPFLKTIYKLIISPRFVITILLILAPVSLIGILIPQGEAEYNGVTGTLVNFLGLNDIFNSPLFLTLLFFFTLDLLFCTIIRIISLRQLFKRTDKFHEAGSLWEDRNVRTEPENFISHLERHLRRRIFRIRITEEKDHRIFYAERGKINVAGSTIVHIGILLMILGAFINETSGFRKHVQIVEGEIYVEPSENFLVRLDSLDMDYYEPADKENKIFNRNSIT